MSTQCRFQRISELWVQRVLEGEEWLLDVPIANLDIGIAWAGMGYLLYKVGPNNLTLELVFHSEEFLFSMEDGNLADYMAYLSPKEVFVISEELSRLPDCMVLSGFDTEGIQNNKIYLSTYEWTGSEIERLWLLETLRNIRRFFLDAARGGHCILRSLG